MSRRDLPVWLVQALAERLEATPREPLRRAQQHLSEVYRAGGHSDVAIRSDEDALAYALVRMPATYAASATVFERLVETDPAFAPRTILDIGAGPGTSSFAAAACWPGIEAVDLFEPHAKMAEFSRGICSSFQTDIFKPCIERRLGEIGCRFDLVVASYVLTELDEPRGTALVEAALRLAAVYVVLIEPGTRRGYRQLMAARDRAIALGASIAAPCPGHGPCPLKAEDWCHFKVRLNRRKEHRLIKDADAPFEDEPYSYLVIAKDPACQAQGIARVLRPPAIGKAEAVVTLCTSAGFEKRTIPRRSKAAYKASKHWSAGDAVLIDPDRTAPEEPHR